MTTQTKVLTPEELQLRDQTIQEVITAIREGFDELKGCDTVFDQITWETGYKIKAVEKLLDNVGQQMRNTV